MALFIDTDLQEFADLGEEFVLKDDCDILRESAGSLDSSGGHPTTWPVHATVKCAVLYDASPRQPEGVAQQKVRRTPNKMLLPRGTDVLETDRLRALGQTYIINGIEDPTSYEIFRTCYVTKLPLQGPS